MAEYFATSTDCTKVAWAIAGRNIEKLQKVAARCQELNGALPPLDCLVGDSTDQASVDKIVAKTKVILSTAGPFMKYGPPVVDACIRFRTDYVDITGEIPYVRDMANKYHEKAKQAGIFIVPMSGFDSIPSDLGAFMAVQYLRNKHGEGTRRVKAVCDMKGGLSGGTAASSILMETSGEHITNQMKDLFLLGGRAQAQAQSSEARVEDMDVTAASFNEDLQCWTAPFMMAGLNTRVVRRSSELFAEAGAGYGPDFSYNEFAYMPNQAKAEKTAKRLLSAPDAKARKKMVDQGVLPKPGEGPSEEMRSKASFHMRLVGETHAGKKCLVTISGGDPGYTETAKMVAESALVLATQKYELGRQGGVVTPSFAMGVKLADRLRHAGIVIEVSDLLQSKL